MGLEFFEMKKKIATKSDGTVTVSTEAVEGFDKNTFLQQIYEKKKQLHSLQSNISSAKLRLVELEDIEITPELEKLKDQLQLAHKLLEKDKLKNDLKTMEMNHANVEREVLTYDNWMRKQGEK